MGERIIKPFHNVFKQYKKMNIVNPYVFGLDIDAQALITAILANGGSLNDNQKKSINKVIISLKSNGLWTKMYAVYLMMGGVAGAHKLNAKNPLDLDSAFRLTFGGGWTHTSSGALPNGTTGYANTHLVPSAVLALNDCHFSYYSTTELFEVNKIEMGSLDLTAPNTTCSAMFLPRTANLCGFIHTGQTNNTDWARYTGAANTLGLFVGSRTSSLASSLKYFKNGSLLATASTNTGTYTLNTFPVYIGAFNNGTSGASFFSSKRCSFSSIGKGLSDAETATLYTIVQQFQTDNGRQV